MSSILPSQSWCAIVSSLRTKKLKGGDGCGTRRRRPTGTRPSTVPDNLENLNHDISAITVKIRYLSKARHLKIARLSLTRNGEVQNRLSVLRAGAFLRPDNRLPDAMSAFGDAGSACNDCDCVHSRTAEIGPGADRQLLA